MQEKFLWFGEKLTNSNRSTSRNFKNETDKIIAKRLLENELAISQCQNLDDYRETHFC